MWKKSVALQKYKLTKYLESIDYLEKSELSRRKKSTHNWNNKDEFSSGMSEQMGEGKYSASQIITNLLHVSDKFISDEHNLGLIDRSFYLAPEDSSKDSSRTKKLAQLLMQNITANSNAIEGNSEHLCPKLTELPSISKELIDESSQFSSSRSRRRACVEDLIVADSIPEFSNSSEKKGLIKFPPVRTESNDTQDSLLPSLFTRSLATKEGSLDITVCGDGSFDESLSPCRRRKVSQEGQLKYSEDIDAVPESKYSMTLKDQTTIDERVIGSESKERKILPKPRINLIKADECEVIVQPRKRHRGAEENLKIKEMNGGSFRKDSNCSVLIEHESSLNKNIKTFDEFIKRNKYRENTRVSGQSSKMSNDFFKCADERLTMSDTEAENKKNIRERYDENHDTIGVKDFVFLALLGKGGFGSVWLVKRKATSDLYALKVIKFNNSDPSFIETMVNENKILMSLVGDYVVKGIFSFVHDRYYCVVMDLMVGGDFRKLLDENNAFYEDDVKFYAAELICAVSHIHEQGITHRDLKPENMLLDNKGHLKLADFGLSNQAEPLDQQEEYLYKVDLDVSIVKKRKYTRIYE
jgi:Protein kinase domain